MTLPDIPSLETVYQRLKLIFPEGIKYRNYVTREMAAKTVFVMFYAGAVDGVGRWIRPSQVTDMTDKQSLMVDDHSRFEWVERTLSSKKDRPVNTWYAANSREPIRDETLRSGFIPCRAVVERPGVPTTSPKPKYALAASFASLFDESLQGDALDEAIGQWQKTHLSKAAMARVQLVRSGALVGEDEIVVILPSGEQRTLAPGPSSLITKAVIEEFAPRFLKSSTVLWLSESGNKVIANDQKLASDLGLKIDVSKTLPDIILVDLGSKPDGSDMLIVFVEVVATDGPINSERKAALKTVALDAGFDERHLAFLTAFMDRSMSPFKKSISELAWDSYAWFVSEPDYLIALRNGRSLTLSEINL